MYGIVLSVLQKYFKYASRLGCMKSLVLNASHVEIMLLIPITLFICYCIKPLDLRV